MTPAAASTAMAATTCTDNTSRQVSVRDFHTRMSSTLPSGMNSVTSDSGCNSTPRNCTMLSWLATLRMMSTSRASEPSASSVRTPDADSSNASARSTFTATACPAYVDRYTVP